MPQLREVAVVDGVNPKLPKWEEACSGFNPKKVTAGTGNRGGRGRVDRGEGERERRGIDWLDYVCTSLFEASCRAIRCDPM